MANVDLGITGLEWRTTLGRGGSGTVYGAFDVAHGRTVAVKVLDTTVDDALRRRFDRERRAMGSVGSHPNIVTILTSGISDHGHPYLVMQHIAGGSLADLLRTGPLGVDEVIRIGVLLSDALGAAHRAGIVHCDVKPANVLIGPDRQPLLTDFGIASVTSDLSMRMTVSATPSFAAPEVLQGRDPDARADQYSLAATLFACLEGHPPYGDTSETMLGVLYQIINDPVPTTQRADLPPAVAATLHRAMAKEPEDRYGDLDQFAAALQDQTVAPTAPNGPGPTGTTTSSLGRLAPLDHPAPPVGATSEGSVASPFRSRRSGVVFAVVALLAVLGVGFAIGLGRNANSDQVAVPDVADRPLSEAVATLESVGLGVTNESACDSAIARSLEPEPGVLVDPGTVIDVSIDPCIVPDFIDMRLNDAIDLIVTLDGLSIEWGDYCDDRVLGQDPPPGSTVAYDTTIAIELRPC